MKTIKLRSLATLLAVLLLIMGTIGVAYAYFSDYALGMGVATLKLSGGTTIDEGTDDAIKNVVITNAENSAPVVVRVGIFGPDEMTVTVPSGWQKSGDFYYYLSVLGAGENTGEAIVAQIKDLTEKEKELLGDNFSITVVHESAVAVYNEDGTIQMPEGWDQSIVING